MKNITRMIFFTGTVGKNAGDDPAFFREIFCIERKNTGNPLKKMDKYREFDGEKNQE